MQNEEIRETDKTRESRLRRHLRKHGVRIQKSRIRNPNINNYEHYRLIQIDTNTVIDGLHYDMTLDEIEMYLIAFDLLNSNS